MWMRRLTQFFGLIAITGIAACSKTAEQTRPPDVRRIDACALLNEAEIESVQGEPMQETQPSSSTGESYFASQCAFVLPTQENSLVITVTQGATGPAGKSPREFWERTFGEGKEESEGAREREDEGKKMPPVKVEGLGDEAFWVGNVGGGGALYVLKDNVYLRLSTGGPDQLEKTKRLAQIALKHL